MKTTAAYAASKRAIAQLTKVIALEYGEQGIRANAIGAGVIETDILSGIVEDSRATLAGYGHMHALGRSASRRRLRKPWPGSLHRVPASLQARWSWRMRVHSHVGPLRLAPAGIHPHGTKEKWFNDLPGPSANHGWSLRKRRFLVMQSPQLPLTAFRGT